jgi:hypothetical protein
VLRISHSCLPRSRWDHVGLVVKLSPRQVYILEYAGGVFLYPLFTRLYTYFAVQGRMIVLRRLSLGRDRHELQGKVEAFVRGVLGQKPPSIEEIIMAVLKQEALLSAFISKLRGSREDDLSSLFCSKLIAAVYKDVGLLEHARSSGDFLPKHFSQRYDDYLDLQQGAVLGPETPISFEAVEEEISALRAQMAQQEWRPETAVRLVSGMYLSAREVGSAISRRFSRSDSAAPAQPPPPPVATRADDDDDPVPANMNRFGGACDDNAPVGASGGVQLASGVIVDEVENVADGGIYSPPPAVTGGLARGGKELRQPLLHL